MVARKRYPVYGQAAITVETGAGPHEKVVNDIIWKLNHFLAQEKKKREKKKKDYDRLKHQQQQPRAQMKEKMKEKDERKK